MCAERYLLSKQIKNFVPLKKSIHKYTVSIYFHKIFLQLGQQESMVNILCGILEKLSDFYLSERRRKYSNTYNTYILGQKVCKIIVNMNIELNRGHWANDFTKAISFHFVCITSQVFIFTYMCCTAISGNDCLNFPHSVLLHTVYTQFTIQLRTFSASRG